jgi:putative acyl-CoA dehydrogenase
VDAVRLFGADWATDAFSATRLNGDWGHAFGTLPHGLDTQAIVDRARIAA